MRSARAEMARRIEHWLELPMVVLGAVWLLLLVHDLLRGSTAATEAVGTTIWIVFVLEFGSRLLVAPRKGLFLRRNWVTALSLVLPALRVLRVARMVRLLRAGRAVRALRLARLLTSFNRGMRTLGSTMGRRGFPYVAALTGVVLVLGAGGMYTFERDGGNQEGFSSFGAALWWTAMLLTTMGSEYWPRTAEGRLVSLLLSVYAFAVFGYITATLASYFVGNDSERERERGDRLEAELVAIRRSIDAMLDQRR
ncbi:MAG: ion transporter [Acidobacteria bacterium]|nr:ion transporter [Acidobacteriota bacterium]